MSHNPAAPCKHKASWLTGIPVHDVSGAQVIDYLEEVIERGQKALIPLVNIHGAVEAMKHPWLREFFRSAQMVFCDGDGFRWGLKILGENPPPKVPFTRLIWDLAASAEKKHYSLYLLGARPGVPEEAAKKLIEKFPALRIAGFQHGYFKKEGTENERVIAAINTARPDVLIVGFGVPFQEEWVCKNWEKIDARIFIPAGGVLDYTAGKLGKVPSWMIRAHLEWLFRIWEEPQRLFARYALEIPYFFLRISWERMKCLFGANPE